MYKNNGVFSNNRLVRMLAVLMILLLSSCTTFKLGRDFDVQAFEAIAKVGETSKTLVRSALGAPKNTGFSLNADGERLLEWVYFYGSGKMTSMDNAELKILQIRFDDKGIVRSYNWTNSGK
ncbi:MAG: hypothetical protein OEY36_06615 [Gammaproteobacteria bacterium]|nr:hypothetical protein [Gammaproteobacteria bacterium]